MSAVGGGEMDAPRARDLRVPTLRPPRRDGNGSEARPAHPVTWLAYSWDMAAARLIEIAPGAQDLGLARVAGWASRVVDGRIVAARREGAELWGRAWRLDESAGARLVSGRHPAGVLEFVSAVDEFGRALEVQLLALGASPPTSGPPAALEAGWALRGAAEAALPRETRRHLRAATLRRMGPSVLRGRRGRIAERARRLRMDRSGEDERGQRR